jgi:hypothetical protein
MSQGFAPPFRPDHVCGLRLGGRSQIALCDSDGVGGSRRRLLYIVSVPARGLPSALFAPCTAVLRLAARVAEYHSSSPTPVQAGPAARR